MNITCMVHVITSAAFKIVAASLEARGVFKIVAVSTESKSYISSSIARTARLAAEC